MARRGSKPFNNPFLAAADALKKEIKHANKEKRKARTAAARAPRPPAEPPPTVDAADRALFLRAVGGPAAAAKGREGPRKSDSRRATDNRRTGDGRRATDNRGPTDEAAAFLDAVGDTKRLAKDPRGQLQPSLPPGHARHIPVYDEDAEALAELEMLVDGITHFDIADTDEFIEGLAEGVDRRLLGKLRRGEFAVQGHLDLHGMRRDDARQSVATFIDQSCKRGHRCVRIVHGRGLNSKDNVPVLKLLLTSWLERGRVGRAVLAFCTARPNDGGAGAVYVLLRR